MNYGKQPRSQLVVNIARHPTSGDPLRHRLSAPRHYPLSHLEANNNHSFQRG